MNLLPKDRMTSPLTDKRSGGKLSNREEGKSFYEKTPFIGIIIAIIIGSILGSIYFLFLMEEFQEKSDEEMLIGEFELVEFDGEAVEEGTMSFTFYKNGSGKRDRTIYKAQEDEYVEDETYFDWEIDEKNNQIKLNLKDTDDWGEWHDYEFSDRGDTLTIESDEGVFVFEK
ncbi:MAG: hypothetical protein ACOC87_00895 [Candidatus Natronoplasma sp.]